MNTVSYPKYESAYQSGIGDLTDLETKVENDILYIHDGFFYEETTPYWLFGSKAYSEIIVPSEQYVNIGNADTINFIWNAPTVVTPYTEFINCPWEPVYNYNSPSGYIFHQVVPTSNVLSSNEYYVIKSSDDIHVYFSPYNVGESLYFIYDTNYWYESSYIIDASINYKLYDRYFILHDNSDEYASEINLGTDIDCTVAPSDVVTCLANVYDRFGAPLAGISVKFYVYPSSVYDGGSLTNPIANTNSYGEAFTTYTIPDVVGNNYDIQLAAAVDSVDPVNGTIKTITDTKILNIAKQRENNI